MCHRVKPWNIKDFKRNKLQIHTKLWMNSTSIILIASFSFLIFLTFIYFWDTEREHEQGRIRERGRHRTWSRLQALSYQPRAPCGAQTQEPWDHDLSRSRRLNPLSHSGAPFNDKLLIESGNIWKLTLSSSSS